jgi:hypothetical protein
MSAIEKLIGEVRTHHEAGWEEHIDAAEAELKELEALRRPTLYEPHAGRLELLLAERDRADAELREAWDEWTSSSGEEQWEDLRAALERWAAKGGKAPAPTFAELAKTLPKALLHLSKADVREMAEAICGAAPEPEKCSTIIRPNTLHYVEVDVLCPRCHPAHSTGKAGGK